MTTADVHAGTADEQYSSEIAAALARYAERMREADSLMARVTPEQFAADLQSGASAAGGSTTTYERLASEELDLERRLAAVRAELRALLRHP